MRLLPLVLALGIVAPTKARARARGDGGAYPPRTRPPVKQQRRRAERPPLRIGAQRSPCGRHTVEVESGAVIVDGRRVHPSLGSVEVLAPPTWRSDGNALAWLERERGETRLVVLADVRDAAPLAWPLPRALSRDRVHWVGSTRVVVGPEALQPRAVASWTD